MKMTMERKWRFLKITTCMYRVGEMNVSCLYLHSLTQLTRLVCPYTDNELSESNEERYDTCQYHQQQCHYLSCEETCIIYNSLSRMFTCRYRSLLTSF